jgi:hypothetical protein
VRLIITPKSVKKIDNVGDQGCYGASNVFAYGKRWTLGPFTCDSATAGLTCKRPDGRGFTASRESVSAFCRQSRSALSEPGHSPVASRL